MSRASPAFSASSSAFGPTPSRNTIPIGADSMDLVLTTAGARRVFGLWVHMRPISRKLAAIAVLSALAICLAPPLAHGAVDYTFPRALSSAGDEALKPQAVVDSQGVTTVVWYGS